MKKGDIFEGVITNYDFPNKGSLFIDGKKVIIKGALEGQKVRFMITKRKSGMAEGKILDVLEPSPIEDIEPSCPYFGMCGGCAYQTMSYKNQLTLKESMVRNLLTKYVDDDKWDGIVASPVYEGYRNKMEFTFGDEFKGGPLALGLHKKGSFHDIVNVSGCKIIGDDWSKILDFTLEFFKQKNIPYYHRMQHTGVLRNLVIRQSAANGEFLINLVASTNWEIKDDDFNGKHVLEDYVKGLLELEKQPDFNSKFAGILYTENDTLGDVVQSDRTILLYGRDYITEEVLGLSFKISPFSFFQTNTRGCEVLYSKAREYIMSGAVMSHRINSDPDMPGLDKCDSSKVVFDLYSGTGTIAQLMSKASKKVIGIEIVEEAVVAARENATLNGLNNCEFIAGDVLKAIDLVDEKPDMIILDPPRDGINPKALDKILAFNVDEMLYISCKPTSLARDLEMITQRGYQVVKACAVDQFPGTGHVETVCLLSRKA